MQQTQFNPGHGYMIRERLGRGRWKEVYRAVYKQDWNDRALAVFLEKPSADDLLKELRLLDPVMVHPLDHVARIYGPFKGDDGQVYLAEELLYRPLEAISPLRSGEQFLRIARDLCTGLAALHGLEPPLVHRDLKLDNCGVDYAGRAKIFDLGSATSEPGQIQGTTLTRAPELFKQESQCKKESDVWALGAVLYALRGEDYPFVRRDEVRNRPFKGSERQRFDEEIKSRVKGPRAEQNMRARLEDIFPKPLREVLARMLAFDPANRPSANEASTCWEALLQSWVRPAEHGRARQGEVTGRETRAFMKAVLAREAGMSALQWKRTSDEIEALKNEITPEQIAELEDLRMQIQRLRESGEIR